MSVTLAEAQELLFREAELLDEGRYADWLELFTDNATYWVPVRRGQRDPHSHVSLMYDDRRLLETRVRRLSNPNMHAQAPASVTARQVSNVRLMSSHGSAAEIRSKLIMVEYRRNEQRLFAGTVTHLVERSASGVRIAHKRVDLVNAEAELEGLAIPF